MDVHASIQQKKLLLAMLLALLLAVIHHALFYGASLGVNYPLFVLLFYGYFFMTCKEAIVRSSRFSWFLFAIIVLLSMTYFLFTNFIFYILNFLAIPILVMLHTTIIADNRGIHWYNPYVFIRTLDHLIPQALRHIGKPFQLIIRLFGRRMEPGAQKTFGKVAVGLVIALPLLLIVIQLLTSADAAFSQMMSGIPEWIGQFTSAEGIFRFMWIIIVFLFMFGYVWGFVQPKPKEEHISVWGSEHHSVNNAGQPIWFDPVIVVTVLAAVNLIYVLFVAVQFSYLFGAFQGALPNGMTYAEQARSGFFELVTVAIINLLILILTLTFSKEENNTLMRWNRILLTSLVVCTGIMLVSAFVRLQLYEQVYGYTYLRFLVHAFMIYVAVLLLFAGLRVWRSSVSPFRSFVLVSLIAYTLLNYVGMDRIIAEQNIRLYAKAGILDTDYLRNLSYEATGLLIAFNRDTGLLNEQFMQKYESLEQEERPWQSYNLSRHLAYKALEREFD